MKNIVTLSFKLNIPNISFFRIFVEKYLILDLIKVNVDCSLNTTILKPFSSKKVVIQIKLITLLILRVENAIYFPFFIL